MKIDRLPCESALSATVPSARLPLRATSQDRAGVPTPGCRAPRSPPITEEATMGRTRTRRLLASAAALALAVGTVTSCRVHPRRAQAAIGGITWQDEFNSPAGRPSTRASGGSTSAAAAGATTSGSTTPTAPATPRSTARATWSSPPARRTRPTTSATTARASTPRPGCSPPRRSPRRTAGSRRGSRSRADRASGPRSGCSATTSAASAGRPRRDRHHGEHRPGAEHRPRHHPRAGLLRRRRHQPATPHRTASRSPTPSTPTPWTGSRTRSSGTVDGVAVLPRRRRPTWAAAAGSSTTRSS